MHVCLRADVMLSFAPVALALWQAASSQQSAGMCGWLVLLPLVPMLLAAVYYVFLSAPKPLPRAEFAARYGPWALVTGAAIGGIGECFALELARRGVHVLLTGRQREPLLATRLKVLDRFPNVHCAVVDGVDMARE